MRKTIKLLELDCANCAAKMEDGIRKLDGVQQVSINFMTEKMVLDVADDQYATVMKQAELLIHRLEPDVVIKA